MYNREYKALQNPRKLKKRSKGSLHFNFSYLQTWNIYEILIFRAHIIYTTLADCEWQLVFAIKLNPYLIALLIVLKSYQVLSAVYHSLSFISMRF